ncbi:5-hydroxytryptamine receptor 2C-like [Ylistrum balloti]|uniref:5-hydroxytryptamine receptor 2C-like n=1 Tax=Ylistrum balloti TaxID=509963 RepID=UPI002905B964|nr:5-hydroxytryptamine receptor 2C-like [Ylistrum balloti]
MIIRENETADTTPIVSVSPTVLWTSAPPCVLDCGWGVDPCPPEKCAWDIPFNDSSSFGGNTSNSSMEIPNDYNWGVLFLSPLIVFGIGGNILVCMAISMEKRLQSVTNYFLLSLAVTDLLVCVIVMPFSIINQFTGYWLFGPIICDLYVTADVLMSTSSILHLCTISLERYMAIRYPLATRNKSKTVVILKIILVWVIALAISSPITILGFIEQSNVLNDKQCMLTNQNFIIYGSICAFFIPLTIMVISYSFTLYLLIGQCNKSKSGQAEGQPMIRRSLSRKPNKQRPRVKFSARRTRSCPEEDQECSQDTTPIIQRKPLIKSSISFPLHSHHRQHNQNSSGHPGVSRQGDGRGEGRGDGRVEGRRMLNVRTEEVPSSNSNSPNNTLWTRETSPNPGSNGGSASPLWTRGAQPTGTTSLQGLVKKHQLVIKAASILLMKKEAIQKENDVHTEEKASKVIGVVFILFVVCWAPFFIVNILTVLCRSCDFDNNLIAAFVWLGWVSSTLNPIIYTMFNNTFKMTFKKLIMCRYDTLQRGKRVRSWLLSNGNAYHVNASSSNSLDTPC